MTNLKVVLNSLWSPRRLSDKNLFQWTPLKFPLLSKMDILSQTNDVLIQQLRYLPVADLLNLCQTNVQFAQLCADPQLWRVRIVDDFPATDVTQIANPREAYLREVRDPRSIYIHINEPEDRIESRLLPGEIIPDERVIQRVQQIAESTGHPYTILYSRPVIDSEAPDIEIVAIQTREGIEYVSRPRGRYRTRPPGEPIPRITQIDILLTNEPRWDQMVSDLAILRQLPPRQRGQQISFVLPTGEQRTLTSTDIVRAERSIGEGIRSIRVVTLALHRTSNTPFHQRESNRIERTYRRQLEAPLQAPTVPQITTVPQVSELDQRRQNILNQISEAMGSLPFERVEHRFLGFRSYQDFLNFQRDYLNRLDQSQIGLLELLLYQVLPRSKVLKEEHAFVTPGIQNFVFDSEGALVFIIPR